MSNPLFSALSGTQNTPQLPARLGNFQQLAQKFNQFRTNYQGNPQQEVQRLLQSGQLTQQQLDQVQGLARQLMQLLN